MRSKWAFVLTRTLLFSAILVFGALVVTYPVVGFLPWFSALQSIFFVVFFARRVAQGYDLMNE